MRSIIKKIGLLLMCLVLSLSFCDSFTGIDRVQAAATYQIQVNRSTNVVTVFDANGEPIKAMTCSTGGANTPLGTYSTGGKYRWWELDGPCWGQYCTRITGHVLFHSVWYYAINNPAAQSTVQYNKLGTPASHGCVRLTVADSKWIYDNCPTGTKVNIIDGTEENDPLGKPKTIQVSTASRTGWDPTDPTPGNPYATAQPSIDTSKVKTKVGYGSDWDPLKNLIATDSCGNDVTLDVKVETRLKTKKLGRYKVTYKLTDGLGRTAKETIKVKVVDNKKATIKGVKSDVVLGLGTQLNLKNGVKAKTVDKKDITKKLKVDIETPSGEFIENYKGTFAFNEYGSYIVTYRVENPRNEKVTTKVAHVTVQ